MPEKRYVLIYFGDEYYQFYEAEITDEIEINRVRYERSELTHIDDDNESIRVLTEAIKSRTIILKGVDDAN